MTGRRLVAAVSLGAAIALWASPTYAHGFGQRYDLPIPLDYFLAGAAATVTLSFVLISLFVGSGSGSLGYPRYDLLKPDRLRSVLLARPAVGALRVASVALFVLVVATSVFGVNRIVDNLSPTFVWIIWWVGMGFISALIGNVWMVLNPWKITFEWVARIAGGDAGGRDNGMFTYPERWGTWPAVVLFFAFAWTENVYTGGAMPLNLGVLVLAYSAITWGGMIVFGKHQWLKRGEAFSVVFGMFSRFSPTEVRVTDTSRCAACETDCAPNGDGCVDCYQCFERAQGHRRQVNLRPYAVGLAGVRSVSLSMAAFVVLVLATVTYDGLSETGPWVDLSIRVYDMTEPVLGSYAPEAAETLGLVAVPAIFAKVYALASWAIRRLSGEEAPLAAVAPGFVYSLVPIALAYHAAHFLSLLLISRQSIIPLASDPFGTGWDLLGTGDYRIRFGLLSPRFVWFFSIGAIVLGHIVAVFIAHVISLRRASERSLALRGQYPMLTLMVLYTATSLWIIAQPIVE